MGSTPTKIAPSSIASIASIATQKGIDTEKGKESTEPKIVKVVKPCSGKKDAILLNILSLTP